jgi:hypothetical protein
LIVCPFFAFDALFMYDFTLACFERALQLADDQTSADVWCDRSAVLRCCKNNGAKHGEACAIIRGLGF